MQIKKDIPGFCDRSISDFVVTKDLSQFEKKSIRRIIESFFQFYNNDKIHRMTKKKPSQEFKKLKSVTSFLPQPAVVSASLTLHRK